MPGRVTLKDVLRCRRDIKYYEKKLEKLRKRMNDYLDQGLEQEGCQI